MLGGAQELTLLRRAWPADDGSLQDAIGEAVASGMLLESPGARLGFAHELVRRAVYDSLPGLARARLHDQVARAVQELHGDDPGMVAVCQAPDRRSPAGRPSAGRAAVPACGRGGGGPAGV